MQPSPFRVLRTLTKQAAIPLILALAYAAWSFREAGEQANPTTFMNALAASFFFLMWLLGQWLRTRKQVGDEEMLVDLGENQQALGKKLDELRTSLSNESLQEQQDQTIYSVLEAAEKAAEEGDLRQAVAGAGVVLEHALRDYAVERAFPAADSLSGDDLVALIALGESRESDEAAKMRWLVPIVWKLRRVLGESSEPPKETVSEFVTAVGQIWILLKLVLEKDRRRSKSSTSD